MSITCNLCGGLGNQLFKIFSLISYSNEQNKPFWFKYSAEFPSNTTRYPYWDTLFSNLKPYVTDKDFEKNIVVVKQEYIDQLSHFENIILEGYFQKPIFFEKYYKEIYDLIDIDEKKKKVFEKLNYKIDDYTSLHFRLGDYKMYPTIHPILSYEYYSKAIKMIGSTKFLYFYENEDTDYVNSVIKKLKEELNVEFLSCKKFELDDWEEMLLMSLCEHNIIANSTFSWWGAYFNSNKNKKVISPEKWFGFYEDMNGRFPDNWSLINI